MQEMVEFSIRTTTELRDFYKERAESEQRSMNAQIVRILEQHKQRATAKKAKA
jgi:hypothetical protein